MDSESIDDVGKAFDAFLDSFATGTSLPAGDSGGQHDAPDSRGRGKIHSRGSQGGRGRGRISGRGSGNARGNAPSRGRGRGRGGGVRGGRAQLGTSKSSNNGGPSSGGKSSNNGGPSSGGKSSQGGPSTDGAPKGVGAEGPDKGQPPADPKSRKGHGQRGAPGSRKSLKGQKTLLGHFQVLSVPVPQHDLDTIELMESMGIPVMPIEGDQQDHPKAHAFRTRAIHRAMQIYLTSHPQCKEIEIICLFGVPRSFRLDPRSIGGSNPELSAEVYLWEAWNPGMSEEARVGKTRQTVLPLRRTGVPRVLLAVNVPFGGPGLTPQTPSTIYQALVKSDSDTAILVDREHVGEVDGDVYKGVVEGFWYRDDEGMIIPFSQQHSSNAGPGHQSYTKHHDVNWMFQATSAEIAPDHYLSWHHKATCGPFNVVFATTGSIHDQRVPLVHADPRVVREGDKLLHRSRFTMRTDLKPGTVYTWKQCQSEVSQALAKDPVLRVLLTKNGTMHRQIFNNTVEWVMHDGRSERAEEVYNLRKEHAGAEEALNAGGGRRGLLDASNNGAVRAFFTGLYTGIAEQSEGKFPLPPAAHLYQISRDSSERSVQLVGAVLSAPAVCLSPIARFVPRLPFLGKLGVQSQNRHEILTAESPAIQDLMDRYMEGPSYEMDALLYVDERVVLPATPTTDYPYVKWREGMEVSVSLGGVKYKKAQIREVLPNTTTAGGIRPLMFIVSDMVQVAPTPLGLWAALETRLLKELTVVAEEGTWTSSALIFLEMMGDELACLSDFIPTEEELLAGMTPSARRRHESAVEGLFTDVDVGTGSAQPVMQKVNELVKLKHTGDDTYAIARVVINVPPKENAQIAVESYATSKILCHLFRGQIRTVNLQDGPSSLGGSKCAVWYMSSSTQEDLDQMFSDVAACKADIILVVAGDDMFGRVGEQWFYSDYSAYDRSQGDDCMEAVGTVLRAMGWTTDSLWYPIVHADMQGSFRNGEAEWPQMRFSFPDALQRSGGRMTTGGNGLANIMAMTAACATMHRKQRQNPFEQAPSDFCQELKQLLAAHGLEAKVFAQHTLQGIEFLRGWAVPMGHRLVWMPLAGQVVKLGKVLSKNSMSPRQFAYGIAQSYKGVPRNYPILGAMLSVYDNLGKVPTRKSSTNDYVESAFYKPRQHEAEDLSPDDEATIVAMMANRYQCDEGEIREADLLLRKIDRIPVIVENEVLSSLTSDY